jgi:hypothetical protein
MFTPGIITYSSLVPENIGNFERSDAFSVECWFCPAATTTQPKALFSHIGTTPKRRGWVVDVMVNRTATYGQFGVALVSDESASNFFNVLTTLGTTPISRNIWYHVVITYNGNSLVSGLKCYFNNVSKNFTVIARNTLTDTIKDDSVNFNVGSSNIYPYFPGKIDEAVVYNRVLTAAEVSQRYNAGVGTENLFGPAYLQYHLNELNGSAVSDSSGNLRNGITVGTPLWVAGKLNNCIQLNGTTQYIQA